MILEFNQVNEVLKKQPVGYYVGRPIKVMLRNCNCSYYSLSKDEIVISYPQIIKCFNKMAMLNIPIETKDVIRIIRTVLYHEVGHAMLTGKEIANLFEKSPDYYDEEFRDAFNIIEDERIEWLLDSYIKNVDFRGTIQLLAAEPGEINTVIGKFFDLVRLNVYEDIWTERVDKLLMRSDHVTYNSDYYTIDRYLDNIRDLYRDYKEAHEDECDEYPNNNNQDQDNESQNNMSGSGNGSGDSNQNNSSDESSGNGSNNQDSTSTSDSDGNNQGQPTSQDVQDTLDKLNEELSKGSAQDEISDEVRDMIQDILDNLEITDEDMDNFDEMVEEVNNESLEDGDPAHFRQVGPGHSPAKIFEDCANKFINDKLYKELTRIFNSVNKVHKMNSAAVNTYSGVIDPRSAGRDDYKFFVQKNRGGNAKAYSKVHLNLFLDRSGSFYSNQTKANEIIHTLTKIEKMNPNFSYTFVTIGEFPRIEDKKNVYYVADGCNDLPDSVPVVFKQVQERNAVNYNLVLFDGEACWLPSHMPNWGAFNTTNTLLISDPDNAEPINRYCPNARVIITQNYTEELIDNIIKTLSSIVR